jgi:hypothetical protein
MTTNTTTNFDSIKIASGRFVNVGHEVSAKIGGRMVVVGFWPELGDLVLRRTDGERLIGGKMTISPSLLS